MSMMLPVTVFSAAGCCPASSRRARPHIVGEQQFTARDREQRVDVDLGNRALVGNREHPHLGDLVTPELDPDRMLGGRRENVEDAAAHGELAAPADHVDPGVGQLDEPV